MRWRAFFGFLTTLLLTAAPSHAQNAAVSATALKQIDAVAADKAAHTPAQQKMDSQLIYAARENRNQFAVQGAPNLKSQAQAGAGTHVITLEVSDGKATSGDTFIINVIAPPPSYKVSGSGTIALGAIFNGKSKAPQNIGKLQVSVASKKGVAGGSVSFDDKLSGLSIRRKNIASLQVNGNVATITGLAKVSGQSSLQNTVVVTGVSSKGSGDIFSIQSGSYRQSGALTQGNLTIALRS